MNRFDRWLTNSPTAPLVIGVLAMWLALCLIFAGTWALQRFDTGTVPVGTVCCCPCPKVDISPGE